MARASILSMAVGILSGVFSLVPAAAAASSSSHSNGRVTENYFGEGNVPKPAIDYPNSGIPPSGGYDAGSKSGGGGYVPSPGQGESEGTRGAGASRPEKSENRGRGSEGFWGWWKGYSAEQDRPMGPTHWMGPSDPHQLDAGSPRGDGSENPEGLRDAPIGVIGSLPHPIWEGLNAAMLLNSEQAGRAPLDQAIAQSREDYGRKILLQDLSHGGAVDVRSRGVDSNGGPSSSLATAGAAGPERLLVTVVLSLDQSGDYRARVDSMGRAVQFSVDARFPAAFGDGGKVQVWGWLPAKQLGDAARLPYVQSVAVHSLPPGSSEAARSRAISVLVALRVPPTENPASVLSAARGRLTLESGFEWTRTIGVQKRLYSTERVLIISGKISAQNWNRLAADPGVLQAIPVSGQSQDASAAAGEPPVRPNYSFLSFLQGHPMLPLLSFLLLAIPFLDRGFPFFTRRRY